MKTAVITWTVCALALAGCGKKTADRPPPTPTDTAAPAAPPPRAEVPVTPATDQTQAQRERAEQIARLDYGTMEDGYIHDPHGQWAASATATSTFGDDGGREPSQSSIAANLVGPPDGKTWTNNHQDIGFDAITATYDKPVSATEVRVVCRGGEAIASISKVELQGTDDSWHTAWSGLSETKQDTRGDRSWFVRTFPKTAHQVKAVKVTFANNVERGYKVVDAVELVGE